MVETAPTCELLRRLSRNRDDAAWGTLLERHGGLLRRCTSVRCGDGHLADDAVQEALLYIRDHAGECRAKSEAQVEQHFDQLLNVNFSGLEIQRVVAFLQANTGLNLVLDPEVAAQDEVPEVAITAERQSLRQILNACLEQTGLVARWQDEALSITRPEELEPRFEPRPLATGRVHAVRRVDGSVDLAVVDRGSVDGLSPDTRLVAVDPQGEATLEIVDLARTRAICRPVAGTAAIAPGAALAGAADR